MKVSETDLKNPLSIAAAVILLGVGFSFVPTSSKPVNYIAIIIISAAAGYMLLNNLYPIYPIDPDYSQDIQDELTKINEQHTRYKVIGISVIVILSVALWYFRSTKLGATVIA